MALFSCALAQTYDVNIDLGITKTDPFDFSGSLLVNKNGTLGNVDVHDPFDNGAFTAASLTQLGGGREAVTLYDYEGRSGPWSQTFSLTFDVNAPLGSSTKTKEHPAQPDVGGSEEWLFGSDPVAELGT